MARKLNKSKLQIIVRQNRKKHKKLDSNVALLGCYVQLKLKFILLYLLFIFLSVTLLFQFTVWNFGICEIFVHE